jgi:hypothetical protein
MRPRIRNAGLVIGAAAAWAAATALVSRDWYLHWGATPEEERASLPGDEFAPRITSTRAVTIHAPVEQVWPWLVQIGQDRAGFYSYDLLERLALADIHNADRIVPEWQHLAAGDTVRLASKRIYGDVPLLRVLAIEPCQYLVLEHWGAFVLRPIDERTTRFLARTHADPRGLLGRVAELFVYDTVHFVMERKMMLGIKARAEAQVRTPLALTGPAPIAQNG